MHMAALEQDPATRNQEKHVLVCDIGSDSSDFAILCMEEGFVEVKSVYGVPVGGNAFTSAIVEDVVAEFEAFHGVSIGFSLAADIVARGRLFAACENAKIALSSADEATIEITALHGGVDWFSTITREQFDALLLKAWSGDDYLERITRDANEKTSLLTCFLLGGSSNIPIVQSTIRNFCGGKPPSAEFDLTGAVAKGAAVQAAIVQASNQQSRTHETLNDLVLSSGELDVRPTLSNCRWP